MRMKQYNTLEYKTVLQVIKPDIMTVQNTSRRVEGNIARPTITLLLGKNKRTKHKKLVLFIKQYDIEL